MFVKELEITLENGMKISGELDLPERQGQWKTIILFHGSGPSDRHATVESMGGIVSRNFDLLSEGFVKARYAVFRYDKRENYDIEIIIRDAREVTRFVSGLSEVEGILFYGWSEGVRVCTTLVSDFPNAQALILQSGIAEGWSSYFSYILRELTVEKLKELDNNSDSILEISDFLNCIPDSTSISFSLYLLILGTDKEGNMKFNEELDPEGKGRFSIIDNWIPLADEIVADPTTLIRFAENAPGETWAGILDDIKKIQLPILVLHGLNDGWISPVEAVQIAKAARNNADIILFKGLGHSLSTGMYMAPNIQLFELDIDKESNIGKFFKGSDLVIGAIGPSADYSEKMLLEAMAENIPYVDPGGIHLIRKMRNSSMKGTAIVGSGIFPGLSGWMLSSVLKEAFNDDLIEMIIGGVYNFSKAAAIDYVEEIKSYKAGIPMACVRNGKILPAQKRSPLNLPTRISKLSILPYVTEEIQEIIQGKYMLNIDSYTAAPVSLFSIVNKAHCQKKDLVNALMGQKNSNQKAFIWVRQNKGNDSRCIYFEGKNPSVLTGEILAITANAIFEMPRKDGIYTMASYLEKYQVLDELKKIDKFKSEGKI